MRDIRRMTNTKTRRSIRDTLEAELLKRELLRDHRKRVGSINNRELMTEITTTIMIEKEKPRTTTTMMKENNRIMVMATATRINQENRTDSLINVSIFHILIRV